LQFLRHYHQIVGFFIDLEQGNCSLIVEFG